MALRRVALHHVFAAAVIATSVTVARADAPDGGCWGDQGDGTYVNPVLAGDFSDPDVLRVGDAFYLVTSTFQYAPGMAILRSPDLVNWQYVGHCIPDVSAIGPELNWDRMNRYGKGVWAGALRYHDGRFWMFTATMDEGIFMTTAIDPAGPWSAARRVSDVKNVDDVCPFWDDDGTAWLAYSTPGKQWHTHVVPMSPDGTSLDLSADRVIDAYQSSEGNKLYKFGGTYYVFHNENRGGANRVGVWLRSNSLAGPWEKQLFLQSAASDRDREPNQGALVDTPDGKRWYFVTHHGRGKYYEGRTLSVMPITWRDGWPTIEPSNADGVGTVAWMPIAKPVEGQAPTLPQASDEFDAPTLSPQWEWNHQPRPGAWSLTARPGYLRLDATRPLKPNDFLKTPGSLTQRVMGRNGGTITAKLDASGLADGGQAGLAIYGGDWMKIGVVRRGATRSIVFDDGGKKLVDGPAVTGDAIWLRATIDAAGQARASYSFDGDAFTSIGNVYTLKWASYRGARIALYAYNDRADEGHVDVDWFHYEYTNGATAR